MMRLMLIAGVAGAALLFCMDQQVDAIGRGGGGRGGGGGGGGRGGGHARPAPHYSGGGGYSRPAIAHSPSVNPGYASRPAPRPSAPRPSGPAVSHRPSPKIDVARPGGGHDFNLPSNVHRPSELPRPGRPEVIYPGKAAGGKAKGDFKAGGGNFADLKSRPDFKGKGNIADLKKNNPGLFDRPGKDGGGVDRFPGAANRPDHRPKKNDIANWLGDKGDHPATRPSTRPDRDKIKGDFSKNWKNAIAKGKINIGKKGDINIGDINVDLSKNVNFQNLKVNANHIHNNFRPVQNNWFNRNWWGMHGDGYHWWHYHWHHHGRGWNYWWRPCTWAALTGWMVGAAWSPPVYYDYGSNVVVNDDVVYVNDEPVASAPVYAEQAIELANVAPPPQDAQIEWLPLGTFALSSKKDDDNPSAVLQLALSKEGMVSGTWYNRTTDQSSEVEGKVDPDTQRLALRKPDQNDMVLEVGVYNLTQEVTPCLVHFGTLNTQQWYLTRLEAPEGGEVKQ